MIGLVDGDLFVYLAYWGSKEDFEAAKEYADNLLENVKEETFCDYFAVAIGGERNFRSEFYLDYKKSKGRANSRKVMPDWIPDLKEYIGSREDAIITDGYEADDILQIWALQCDEKNIDYMIITHDKDLDCIPGLHFNPKVWKTHTVGKDYPTRFFYKQLLMGDSIDNIPGIKGIGPKKAETALSDCSTKEEMEKVVCKLYHEAYGEEGYPNLIANGRLLHLWRFEHDYFKLEKEIYDKNIAPESTGSLGV